MAKVRIKNMMFYGFHGIYEYEREQGQKFYVDIEVDTGDDDKAGINDNPAETVLSANIYAIVRDAFENTRFMLLQALGYHVNTQILKNYPLAMRSTIKIRKPSVPIAGLLDCVEIEVSTGR